MKSSVLLTAAFAASGAMATPSGRSESSLFRRQANNQIGKMMAGMVNPKGGKVPDPPGFTSKRVDLPPRTPDIPGAKTVKLRYGPYKVPNMGIKNVLGEEGALWNYADNVAPKPCEKCAIIGMNAGLEYPDGKNANIDTGLWLHHFVLLNIGPGRWDATCRDSPISLPHMLLGASARNSERLFSSGNERTQAILPTWGEKNVGYKLQPADKFGLIVDLMNENMQDSTVYLTITFDYVDGHPDGWDDMKPIWFDVAQCLTSEWPAPYESGKYTIPAAIWTANVEGDIIGAAGHLHDGGQRVQLEVDGEVACQSDASYGTKPEFIGKSMPGAHGAAGPVKHLSQMTICIGDTLLKKKMVKGQKWKLKAEYDYEKNGGNHHGDGKQANVMGISIMYVRQKAQAAKAQAGPKQ